MKRNCAFTICAKNYIGLASILERSFKRHNPDSDFFIFVADEFEKKEDEKTLPPHVIICRHALPLTDRQWEDMAFKYNLTEFCTAIKPSCFQYLFENTDYVNYVYFDPDIYFFAPLTPVFEVLTNRSIVITPHILDIEVSDNGERTAENLLFNGTFNLGFIALKKDDHSRSMIRWWEEKLSDQCFIEALDAQFTDQKWINLLPAFFGCDVLHISRNKGLNVAPWNFYEREILSEKDSLYVKFRREGDSDKDRLIFVHYSGYDYAAFLKKEVIQKNIANLPDYRDIRILTESYGTEIRREKELFNRYIDYKYTYNTFENGVPIDKINRRLYRGLVSKGEKIDRPFSCAKAGYFERLRKAGLIRKNRESPDKIVYSSVQGLSGKLRPINGMSKILFKLLGYKRHQLLIRFLLKYSRFESHLYLVDKKYRNTLF